LSVADFVEHRRARTLPSTIADDARQPQESPTTTPQRGASSLHAATFTRREAMTDCFDKPFAFAG